MQHKKYINIIAYSMLFISFIAVSCTNMVDSVSKIKIDYHSDKDAKLIPSAKEVDSNYSIVSSDIPKIDFEGYQLEGWYIGDKKITEGYTVTTNIILEAKWNPNKYTIRFNANGGEGSLSDVQCIYDEKGKLLPENTFTNLNCKFLGWNTKKDGTGTSFANKGEYSNLTSENNGVVTLYAQWENIQKTDNPIFSVTASTIDYKEKITLISSDAKIYYTTDGSNPTVESKLYDASKGIVIDNEKGMTIKAVAIKEGFLMSDIVEQTYTIKTYSITFVGNGVENPKKVTGLKASDTFNTSSLPDVSRDNYDFLGWYYDGKKYSKEAPEDIIITKDITFEAQWKKYGKVSNVIISPKDGNTNNPTLVDNNTKITLTCPIESAQIYYSIGGGEPKTLYTEASNILISNTNENVIIRAYAKKAGLIDSDITEAVYSIKTYSVSFNNGGADGIATIVTETGFKKGDKIGQTIAEAQNKIKKANHTLDGWYDSNDKKIDDLANYKVEGNITLFAKWTQDRVKNVSFVNVGEGKVDFGDKIELSTPTAGATIYFAFGDSEFPNGWETFNPTTGIIVNNENDFTLRTLATKDGLLKSNITSQNFIVNKYEITLVSEIGAAPDKKTVVKNKEYQLPIPKKQGSNFLGWYSESSFDEATKVPNPYKVSNSITLYAKWERIPPEKVTFSKPKYVKSGTPIKLFCSTPNTKIYYTTDGITNPSPSTGTLYDDNNGIIISNATTIKAVSFLEDAPLSEIAEAKYDTKYTVYINTTPFEHLTEKKKLVRIKLGSEGILQNRTTWYIGEGSEALSSDNVFIKISLLSAGPHDDSPFSMIYKDENFITPYTVADLFADSTTAVFDPLGGNIKISDDGTKVYFSQIKSEPVDLVKVDYSLSGHISSDLTIRGSKIINPLEDYEDYDKPGYCLIWQHDGKEWDFSKDTVQADTTLIAVEVPISYTVSYDLLGGTYENGDISSFNKKVSYEEEYQLPDASKMKRAGWIFDGWSVKNPFSIENIPISTKAVRKLSGKNRDNVTLIAKWKKESSIPGLYILDKGISGSGGTQAQYIQYGSWPQTRVDDTKINIIGKLANPTEKLNGWDCYKDENNNYYVKLVGKNTDSLFFNDGTQIQSGKTYFFRLEPIKWRVLTDNFVDATGTDMGKLLLCEDILTTYHYSNSEAERTINGNKIYSSNYEFSDIKKYLNEDFVSKAFPTNNPISETSVRNDAKSMGEFNSSISNTTYASNLISKGKLFLLSEEEVTTPSFGFSQSYGADKSRVKLASDFTKAQAVYSDEDGTGWWWLRSPYYYVDPNSGPCVYAVTGSGYSQSNATPNETTYGVAPAMCIKF